MREYVGWLGKCLGQQHPPSATRWEAEATRSEQMRIGQTLRWRRELTIGCLQMYRWVVIFPRVNVLSSEGYSHLIAAQAKAIRIDGERKVLVGGAISRLYLLKAKARKRAEMLLIEGGDLVAAAGCLLEHTHTTQAQQGIELCAWALKPAKALS